VSRGNVRHGVKTIGCDTECIITSRILLALISTTLAAGCVRAHAVVSLEAYPATCRGLVAESGATDPIRMAWHELDDSAGRLAMARSCGAVGPAVYLPPVRNEVLSQDAIDKLVILSWNVHVGGGDVAAIVRALREGNLTGGEPVGNFIVLLQEAFRAGTAVPNSPVNGASIPRRIEEFPPDGLRRDILQSARELGLGVFYVPSMRNGSHRGVAAEDRGNAILSTLPLSDLTGIELPFERQRRIAASATVSGVDTAGNPWQLRLVTAHLNATASMKRLWVFSAGVRERQARHLAGVLARAEVPTVVGSDLNSWAGGPSEPAYSELRAHFPQTPALGGEPTFRGGRMLDFVFLRVPPVWARQLQTLSSFFGSDHRPLIGSIEFLPSS
jgi:endonuclease/exonuclease/phosphatase family metal-dependent hydrolase